MPTRILQVLGSLKIGGAESRMMDVYRHIDKNKYEFDFLIFSSGEQPFEDEVRTLGGRVYRLESPSPRNMNKVLRKMRDIMRKGGYDAVHAHVSYFCGLVMLAAEKEGIGIRISHARTSSSKRSGITSKISFFIGRTLIRRYATKLLAVSQSAAEYLFGNMQYTIVPNAIDLSKFSNINTSRHQQLKDQYNLTENMFIIGHVGRFDHMKNHAFLLEWFSYYLKSNQDALLVMVGDGPLREEMEQKSLDLGINEHVRFTGIIKDVHHMMQMFSVFAFPSLFEGLPGSVLEAQAAGVPVVISDRVTLEVDMGLGMVKQCNLDKALWSKAISEYRSFKKPSYDDIEKAFDKRHYSLNDEIKTLSMIYEGRE